jgi:23S rRNA (cytosine1962-C5)-methyltransferase
VDVRKLEGLPERPAVVRGAEPPERIQIREHGCILGRRPGQGHKTGYYLDQRPTVLKVRELAQAGRFWTASAIPAGLLLSALAGGASSVLAIDASGEACHGRRKPALNDLP